MLDANRPSEGKSRSSPLLARAFALHSAEQRDANRLGHREGPISKVDNLDSVGAHGEGNISRGALRSDNFLIRSSEI